MAQFLCFSVYDGKPGELEVPEDTNPLPSAHDKEPVSWCALGNSKVHSGPTLEYVKAQALLDDPFAQFLDNCGWFLSGEEHKLLEPDYQEIIAFGMPLET